MILVASGFSRKEQQAATNRKYVIHVSSSDYAPY